jgi:predicted TIM-barrel fold metal-dependent hydrolase
MKSRRNPFVIDAHCHLERERSPVEPLIEKMEAAGVDMAISLGSGGNPLERLSSNNDYNLQAAKRYPKQIIPFIYFDPRYEEDGLEEIDRCMEKSGDIIKGIKVGHRFAVARYMYSMMEKAQEYRLVVGIHCDSSVRSHPYIIANLANSFPKVDVIMLHMSMRQSAAAELLQIKAAEKNPNVWFETSFSNPYPIKMIVERLGADRIMFGSDHSILVGSEGYESVFEHVKYEMMIHMHSVRCLGLPKEQEDKIMGLNAARLFGVEVER